MALLAPLEGNNFTCHFSQGVRATKLFSSQTITIDGHVCWRQHHERNLLALFTRDNEMGRHETGIYYLPSEDILASEMLRFFSENHEGFAAAHILFQDLFEELVPEYTPILAITRELQKDIRR